MRYRWLDSDRPVVSCAPNSPHRGNTGCLIILPRPGRIANRLVDFAGRLVVCPAGTLRNLD